MLPAWAARPAELLGFLLAGAWLGCRHVAGWFAAEFAGQRNGSGKGGQLLLMGRAGLSERLLRA